jgi:FlaA1/EpsC-like NDP-sugar epimerase
MKESFVKAIEKFKRITVFKRMTFFFISDILLIVLSMHAAFWLRFDNQIPVQFKKYLLEYSLLSLAIKLLMLAVYKQYSFSWRFYSLHELMDLFRALFLSSIFIVMTMFFFKPFGPFREFPRSILLLDFLITLGLIGGLRIAKRVFSESRFRTHQKRPGQKRILIIGAGQAGEQIGREMLNNKKSKFFPVGYIDDNPAKLGIKMHGIKVIGTRDDLPTILKGIPVDEVLMAIPSADSKEVREIVEIIRKSDGIGRKIKVLPGISNLMDGNVTLSDIQEIRIEDLLGREPVYINTEVVREFLSGKRVLITGAGGSIGSELVRTIIPFEPKALALLDIDETELFNLMHQIQPVEFEVRSVVGDVRDRWGMSRLFKYFRPEIVVHSAAYKHVPVLENFPLEAVKTNVLGAKVLGEMSLKNGVEKFINISTDKAINPTSVMGATKRVAEELFRMLNKMNGTRFISVRFGNVLGSRGSVIPLFKDQIQKGGPVTVTHPDMKRYFMAPSEAVRLVLEASATGEGGETFILDMGKPIRIVDLASDMIRLSGYEPDVDIAIVYSGVRPGEKFFEELLSSEEGSEPTGHPKIFKARNSLQRDESVFFADVERLINLCHGDTSRKEIFTVIKEIIPTYNNSRIYSLFMKSE